jgi:hypothetical protein
VIWKRPFSKSDIAGFGSFRVFARLDRQVGEELPFDFLPILRRLLFLGMDDCQSQSWVSLLLANGHALEKDTWFASFAIAVALVLWMRSLEYDRVAILGTAAVTSVVFPCILQAGQPRSSLQRF